MKVSYILWQLTWLLFVLKLTDHIQWGWFWVLSPMLLFMGIFLFLVTYFLFAGGGDDDGKRGSK